MLILSSRVVCWPASSPLLWSHCSFPTWTWPPCCTWRPPAGSCRRWSVTVASIPGDSGGWRCRRTGRRIMKKPETVRIANSNSSSTHTNSQNRRTFYQTTESHKISLFLGRQINFQSFSQKCWPSFTFQVPKKFVALRNRPQNKSEHLLCEPWGVKAAVKSLLYNCVI